MPSRALRLPAITRAALTLALAAVLAALAGCGDDDEPDATRNASVKPGDFCFAVAERRRLADNLPEIGLLLQNSDVDNFTGDNSLQCNQRQIAYWGPEHPFGGARTAVRVGLFFAPQGDGELPGESDLVERREKLPDGSPLFLFSARGEASARFSTEKSLVTIRVACVLVRRPDEIVPCPGEDAASAARLDRARVLARELAPTLKRYL